ncbi:MAG: MATE family efflux transporter [Spirochaetales bacterium]|nr:MATE family efflux transporter [Spirochaetales bacterium]
MKADSADLTKGSLLKHLRRLAIPSSTGFLFSTMYNVVDTFWAGRLSTDSLAALSLNFPLFMLVMSLGIGFAGAAGALVANAIGAGDAVKARKYHAQVITLAAGFSIITAVLLFNFLRPIFQLLNGEGDVLRGALAYGRVIIFGMPFLNLAPVAGAGLTARGDTLTYRNVLIAGFLLNIGLDPLFMYIFEMKEAGVAMATVLIQILTLVYMLMKLVDAGGLRGMRKADFFPKRAYVLEILQQSVPATANFMTMSLGTFVLTWFISSFGRDAVAAYGAAVRVEQIALVPTAGLNTALSALTGQNNGAGRMDRVIKSFRLSLIGGVLVMVLILPPVLIFGKQILGLFTETESVIRMGYNYLLLQGITYYSYIILFQSNSVLQGLKKPAMIMWMGLYRQIIAPAGVFYFFCFTLGMAEKGVWRGLILINWSAAVITLVWAMHVFRQACHDCFDRDND